jgi:Holliday junction DNA helicase RuvA
MIGYLEGTTIKILEDGILLLAGHVGYEIMLPAGVLSSVTQADPGTPVRLFIYHHQTERQPKPVLIGFSTEEEKAFFQLFITVDAIGPMKAVKAMERPVHEMALAIENEDVDFLAGLRGVGKRTAQKIIASLHGKTDRFLDPGIPQESRSLMPGDVRSARPDRESTVRLVMDVLVEQLGHSTAAARQMISEALARNEGLTTPEELFDEIYRGGNP